MYSSAHMSANRYVSKICFYLHGVVVDVYFVLSIFYILFQHERGPGTRIDLCLEIEA